MINFANINKIIYILPVSIAVVIFFVFYAWYRRHALYVIFKGRTPESLLVTKKHLIKEILLIMAIILFVILVLRPQWGEHLKEVRNEGTDLLVALDVSRSMLAQDIKPSRLERAKDAIRLLVESLSGDRVGLILFAGNSFMQCPFTNDVGAFMMFLDSATPESIELQGTNISAALKDSEKIFKKKNLNTKILLLITDGEDHEGKIKETVKSLKSKEVKVYTAGIGNEKGGLIPLGATEESGDIYLRDMKGNLVRTKTDVTLLKNIANETGGDYIDLTNNLSGIYKMIKVLKAESQTDFGARLIKQRKEQYQYVAAILIFILLLELFVSVRSKVNG